MQEQNNIDGIKSSLISQYVDEFAPDYIEQQLDSENAILEVFEQLMKSNHKNSNEYKNAKVEFDKQTKVLDYFGSEAFKELYKQEYKQKLDVLTLEEIGHLYMQQRLIKKVRDVSIEMNEMVCTLAENVGGDTVLNA